MRYVLLSNFSRLLSLVKTQSKAGDPFGKLISGKSLDYLEELAVVIDTIQPYQPGRIYFQASWWPAVCEQNVVLLSGTTVCVTGMRNITYIVEPLHLISNNRN